ncbi:hypothetical protein [Providencia sp. PROV197]|uniref:hypothetical protein n=1 Tax=Providencia sp. PROV197 TaxID=2949898 RepID=UPI002349B67E|nr:hypothetical protein [Providencia sp. PROV197]
MNKPEMRKAKSIRITTSGTVIKAPERVKTATGKVMATMTIQAESDKRSPYPLKIVAFDINALELMTCQKGNKVKATGRYEWFNGYQLTGAHIVSCQQIRLMMEVVPKINKHSLNRYPRINNPIKIF